MLSTSCPITICNILQRKISLFVPCFIFLTFVLVGTMEWIVNNGLTTAQQYPFAAVNYSSSMPTPECRRTEFHPVAKAANFLVLTPNNEYNMLLQLQRGPLYVSICAASLQFQAYTSGIFDYEVKNSVLTLRICSCTTRTSYSSHRVWGYIVRAFMH